MILMSFPRLMYFTSNKSLCAVRICETCNDFKGLIQHFGEKHLFTLHKSIKLKDQYHSGTEN